MWFEPDLSICTIVRDKPQKASQMLRSIYDTADPVAVEIIVADMSSDGSAASLLNDFPGLKIFENAGEQAAAAYNNAMRIASGRYTCLFDHDTIVQEECLQLLVDFMDDTPDVGICGPQIINAYGRTQRSARRFDLFPAFLAQFFVLRVLPSGLWFGRHMLMDWDHQSSRDIDWLCSGVHIIRREVIEEIGLLDPFSFNFEQDYYFRAKKTGWHNHYLYGARVVHPNPQRYDPTEFKGGKLGEAITFYKKRLLS